MAWGCYNVIFSLRRYLSSLLSISLRNVQVQVEKSSTNGIERSRSTTPLPHHGHSILTVARPFVLFPVNHSRFKIRKRIQPNNTSKSFQGKEDTSVVDYDLDIGQAESFKQLGVKPSLCRALECSKILSPTDIQYQALPFTMTKKRHCIIRSETGTGKTLTFLLPALQEQLPGLTTLILVPTRELAVQMYHQTKKLIVNGSDKRTRRTMVVFSGSNDDEEENSLAYVRPHILIGTPKRVLNLLCTNEKHFISLRRLILDEVDKLLLLPNKRSARKQALREIHPRPAKLIVEKVLALGRRYKTQLIATSATVDHQINEELSMLGWGVEPEVISTSNEINHLISPNSIEHHYLQCYGDVDTRHPETYDKLDALVDHFRTSGEKSALIFIHRNAPISRFLYDVRKRGLMAEALHENCLNPSQYQQFLEDFKSGKIEMVVCTEETVRGLDFVWLSTVYLMVVPRTATEYLHLCGRVGRVGRSGRAIVILEDERELTRMSSHYMKLRVRGQRCWY